MYELKMINESAGRRYMLLDNSGGTYKISEVLYHLLYQYKLQEDFIKIAEEMNTLYETADFTVSFIEASINSALRTVSKKESNSHQTDNTYIKGKIVVVKEGQLQPVYKLLALLFYKKTFAGCALLSVVSTLFFFYEHHLLSVRTIYQSSLGLMSAVNLVIVYFIFVLIILVHEIGHASASFRFGVRPKEIGFGFYFVFPVFYTNVTGIWALTKEERNTVNIAGIYFQLIINGMLIGFFYLQIFKVLVFTLILVNTTSVITSLIPFFRYDGYWLFSDYFDIPNLQHKSRTFVVALFHKPQNAIGTACHNPRSLIIYSYLNILFWIYVYLLLLKYIITNMTLLHYSLLHGTRSLTLVTLKDSVSTIMLGITIYLLVSQILTTFKFLYHESRRIYRTKSSNS